MAGDWLKVEVNLPRKPEVWQMATLLGLSADDVTGKLIRVWAWFDAHTENGHAVGVTYPLIDAEAGVVGFAEAMVFVGWLEQRDRTMVLPKFERHNGKTAKNRALARDRKQESRENGHDPVPPASRSMRDQGVTREEKRREEEKQEQGGASPAPPACPHSEIVALYHEILPELARVKDWTEERQTSLRARWREDTKRQSLDYWRRFFGHVAKSDFLMGRAPPKPGSTAFIADLEWLVKKANFVKVIEGKYHAR